MATQQTYMEQPMRCERCGEVIGVYEPLVLITQEGARTTSAAAEPHVAEESGERLHRACHQEPLGLASL